MPRTGRRSNLGYGAPRERHILRQRSDDLVSKQRRGTPIRRVSTGGGTSRQPPRRPSGIRGRRIRGGRRRSVDPKRTTPHPSTHSHSCPHGSNRRHLATPTGTRWSRGPSVRRSERHCLGSVSSRLDSGLTPHTARLREVMREYARRQSQKSAGPGPADLSTRDAPVTRQSVEAGRAAEWPTGHAAKRLPALPLCVQSGTAWIWRTRMPPQRPEDDVPVVVKISDGVTVRARQPPPTRRR